MDGTGTWLAANAQAILLAPTRGGHEQVLSLDPRALRLEVGNGTWPKPFVIEVPTLTLRIVWANPSQPPKLEGPALTRF